MVELSLLDAIQIVGVGSAVVVAIIAIIQTKRTQQQVDNSLRPWIGISDEGIKLQAHGTLTAALKNHGTLPAEKSKIWTAVHLSPFTREMAKTLPRKVLEDEAVIMPNAIKTTSWNIPEYDRIFTEQLTVHLSLVVEYEYANQKKATYYLCAHYNPYTQEQAIDFEFLE